MSQAWIRALCVRLVLLIGLCVAFGGSAWLLSQPPETAETATLTEEEKASPSKSEPVVPKQESVKSTDPRPLIPSPAERKGEVLERAQGKVKLTKNKDKRSDERGGEKKEGGKDRKKGESEKKERERREREAKFDGEKRGTERAREKDDD